jgi:hypothetical protein
MYQVTRTAVRPSTDVDFYHTNGDDDLSVQFRAEWWKNYIQTQDRLILMDVTLSEDTLTKTTVFIWDCEESWHEAGTLPAVSATWADRNTYNDTHGIVITEVGSQL